MFKHSSTADNNENMEISNIIPEDKKSLDSADAQEFVIVNKHNDTPVSQDTSKSSHVEHASVDLELKNENDSHCSLSEVIQKNSRYIIIFF